MGCQRKRSNMGDASVKIVKMGLIESVVVVSNVPGVAEKQIVVKTSYLKDWLQAATVVTGSSLAMKLLENAIK